MTGCRDGAEIEIPPDAGVADDNQNPRRRRSQYGERPEVGILVEPDESDVWDRLILHEECKADLLAGLRVIQTRAELERVWSISKIQPMAGRCVMNFYGPPGTGKTRAARAIAKHLGKCIYQIDYSSVISKYLGDTAKHIVQGFQRAKDLDAILFFDEADSLLSKRVDMDQSCATSINQNRNTLMQELDRFDGVVLTTTNLFSNFDPAMLRRIAKHVKFDLPDRVMRKKLLALHLPNPARVVADLGVVATRSQGLSGGDILNVCLNAIYAGSVDEDSAKWVVTTEMLIEEVEKVRAAKADHSPEDNVRFGN